MVSPWPCVQSCPEHFCPVPRTHYTHKRTHTPQEPGNWYKVTSHRTGRQRASRQRAFFFSLQKLNSRLYFWLLYNYMGPTKPQQGSELLELLLAQTTPPRHVVPVIGGNRLDGFPPLVLENPIPMIPMTLCFVQQPGLLAWKAVQPDGRGIRFEKSIPACPPTYLTGFACIPTCLHT